MILRFKLAWHFLLLFSYLSSLFFNFLFVTDFFKQKLALKKTIGAPEYICNEKFKNAGYKIAIFTTKL